MATEAPINANRQNARKSTGPKTRAGKARAGLNALKHGKRARTAAPVLPQEDPVALEAKIGQWVEDLQPENDAERDLVEHAARISWQIDRAERCETARLSRRVKRAQFRSGQETVDRACELGRKLLYMAGPRLLPTSGPPWDDNPAA